MLKPSHSVTAYFFNTRIAVEFMDTLDGLNTYLNEFAAFEKIYPGPILQSIQLKSGHIGPHFVFSGVIHGNEVGSLPAFLKAIQYFEQNHLKFNGTITFILGNIKAALAKERFIEQDLNRAFSSFDGKTYESRRAEEIARVIKIADIHIDFHQTIEPTRGPFFLFSDNEFNIQLANALDCAKVAIVRDPSQGLAYGQMTSGEYAESLNIPTLTIELSQKGFNVEAETICFSVMEKILNLFPEKIDISAIPQKNIEIHLLRNSKKQKFAHPLMHLVHGLINLDPVKKGTLLGYDENKNPLHSPEDGYILFPKYPKRVNEEAVAPLPSDIFMIVYD